MDILERFIFVLIFRSFAYGVLLLLLLNFNWKKLF